MNIFSGKSAIPFFIVISIWTTVLLSNYFVNTDPISATVIIVLSVFMLMISALLYLKDNSSLSKEGDN